MTLLFSLVAAACAVMVAYAFVVGWWRHKDVVVTLAMGAVLLFLLVVAIVGLRVSL
jgi:hypothetical protein